MQPLLIEDGYTMRVGFNAARRRRAFELTVRPFAGAERVQRSSAVVAAKNQTAEAIADMLGDGKERQPRISDLTLPGVELTPEGLRKLRPQEFEAIMAVLYEWGEPDYEVIDGEKVPFDSSEEREKNS